MKQADKKKPIKTIPKGVWEGSRPNERKAEKESPSEDLQKNGYPAVNKKES